MIKVEHIDVYGWKAAVRGMRNPMNSWDRSDSEFYGPDRVEIIGLNDQELMMKLAKGGAVHAKYRRMISVTMDITAPLYFWKHLDTYSVGTSTNSTSTMHKIHGKEFTLDDFSHEHLINYESMAENEITALVLEGYPHIFCSGLQMLQLTVGALNYHRKQYLETGDKRYWWQMIQLLPSSYNQLRTWSANYEVLARIYRDRKDHKLDEWHDFCDMIRGLPHSEIITLEE